MSAPTTTTHDRPWQVTPAEQAEHGAYADFAAWQRWIIAQPGMDAEDREDTDLYHYLCGLVDHGFTHDPARLLHVARKLCAADSYHGQLTRIADALGDDGAGLDVDEMLAEIGRLRNAERERDRLIEDWPDSADGTVYEVRPGVWRVPYQSGEYPTKIAAVRVVMGPDGHADAKGGADA